MINRISPRTKSLAPLALTLLLSCNYSNMVTVTRRVGVDDVKASLGQGQTNPATEKPVVYMLVRDDDGFAVVAGGGPEDKGGGEVIDLWGRDTSMGGSIFGFGVNQAMKITVASTSFEPRVVVLHSKGSSLDKPAFAMVVNSKTPTSTAGGVNVNVVSYRLEGDKRPLAIGVLSADGKTGEYTIKIVGE